MFVSISGTDYYAFNTWGDVLPTTWAAQLLSSWARVKGPRASQVMMNSSPMVRDLVEDRSTADFSILDLNHVYRFTKGEYVTILDSSLDTMFAGFIDTATELRLTPEGGIEHRISCIDNHYLADKRILATAFVSPSTVADAVTWIITNILAAEGVTVGTIDADIDVIAVSFDYVTASEALDQLSQYAGTTWYIDVDKKLYFIPRTTIPADWNISETGNILTNVLANSFSKESGNPEYRNVQYIRGGSAKTDPQTELKPGDGATTSWAVGYRLAEQPISISVYYNGSPTPTPQLVGIKGVDVGSIPPKDFYWSSNDQVILQDGAGVVLKGKSTSPAYAGDILEIKYYGLYQIVTSSADYGAIADRQLVEYSTSGKVESVRDDSLITDEDSGLDEANAILAHYATIGTKVNYTTLVPGLNVGSLQHITSTIHDMDDDFLITQVEKAPMYYDDLDLENAITQYSITAVSGPVEDYWTKVFLKMNSATSGATLANSSAVVLQLRNYAHTWTDPDTYPDIWDSAIADGNFQLDDALVPSFAIGDEVSYISLWKSGVEKFRKYRTAQSRTTGHIITTFIISSGEANTITWDTVKFYGGDNASSTLGTGTLVYSVAVADGSKNSLLSLQMVFTANSY
jgi:hypothetical protein